MVHLFTFVECCLLSLYCSSLKFSTSILMGCKRDIEEQSVGFLNENMLGKKRVKVYITICN